MWIKIKRPESWIRLALGAVSSLFPSHSVFTEVKYKGAKAMAHGCLLTDDCLLLSRQISDQTSASGTVMEQLCDCRDTVLIRHTVFLKHTRTQHTHTHSDWSAHHFFQDHHSSFVTPLLDPQTAMCTPPPVNLQQFKRS